IDANGSWLAGANHLDGFTLHIRLAATTPNSAENFSPNSYHHFGADFTRRRSLRRNDRGHSQGSAFVEEFFDLVVDRVLLFAFRIGIRVTSTGSSHISSSKFATTTKSTKLWTYLTFLFFVPS